MRRFAGKLCTLLLAMLMCVSLVGCFKSVDELYQTPQTLRQDTELQNILAIKTNNDLSFATPRSGNTRQSTVGVDIDGDGYEEYICFFVNKYDPTSFQIVTFWKAKPQRETYNEIVIPGKADSIDSFNYFDIDRDGTMELIVGWQESSGKKTLEVYRPVIDATASGLKVSFTYEKIGFDSEDYTDYTDYRLCRFSDTAQSDDINLFVIRYLSPDDTYNREREAVIYALERSGGNRVFSPVGSVLLSHVTEVENIIITTLSNGVPVAYIDSDYYYDVNDGYITDIITYNNGRLVNLTRPNRGVTAIDTKRPVKMRSCDIDGDGLVEVPSFEKLNTGSQFSMEYAIRWRYYSFYSTQLKLTTYYYPEDSWYYILPNDLPDKLFVRRERDYGVQSVIFSYKTDSEDSDIFRIVALRGENIEKLRGEIIPNGTLLERSKNGEVEYYGEVMLKKPTVDPDKPPENPLAVDMEQKFAESLTEDMQSKFVSDYPQWLGAAVE